MSVSYRIAYDGTVGKYEIRRAARPVLPVLLGTVSLVLFGFLIGRPEGRAKIQEFLIPGDSAVTVQAFHAMTDDLRSGARWKDALYEFGYIVVHGG